jgi:hypothetical protein
MTLAGFDRRAYAVALRSYSAYPLDQSLLDFEDHFIPLDRVGTEPQ